MKKEIDWNAVFPKESAAFSSRIEYTLSGLKEEKEMKKVMRPLAVALVLMLLIAGTALAVTNTEVLVDLFHRMYGLQPAENAAESVSEALGTIRTDDMTLTVRSAVYDGRCVRMLVAAEAADPEHVILFEENFGDEVLMGNAEQETVAEYAARTGKRILNVGWIDFDAENARLSAGRTFYDREGETLLLFLEQVISGEQPETVNVVLYVDGKDSGHDLHFDLPLVHGAETHYVFEQPEGRSFTVLDAVCEHTPFADYFTLAYAAKAGEPVPMDIETVYYATEKGTYVHTDSTCCGMANASVISAEEIEAQGRKLCPICCDGNAFMMRGNIWGWVLTGDDSFTLRWSEPGALECGAEVNGEFVDNYGGDYMPEVYGIGAQTATVLLQAGTFPQGDLVLTPVAPDGTPEQPILLKAAE